MKWILSVIAVIVFVTPSLGYSNYALSSTATCASIGYADRCCPQGADCTATDGSQSCTCDSGCYSRNNCCQDVFCSPTPTTCQAAGITQCCDDPILNNCRVKYPSNMVPFGVDIFYGGYAPNCSCDVGCHDNPHSSYEYCCPDAVAIGCLPSQCSHVGKVPGCCQWSPTSSCYVNSADCYCDSYCVVFNDCCPDVPMATCNAPSMRQQTTGYSKIEKELMKMHVQKYSVQPGLPNQGVQPNQGGGGHQRRPINLGGQSPPQTNGYDHHRLALTSRLDRARMNAREFRGRARASMQRPNNYNNYYYDY